MSPNLMMFGEELPLPIDLMVGAPPRHENRYKCRTEYVEWLRQTLSRAHDFARGHLGVAANRQKAHYDQTSRPVNYPVGSFVWYWYPPKANRKLGIGWTGPYRVMSRPTEIHCVLQLVPGVKPKRVHINQLKAHLGREPPSWHGYSEPQQERTNLSRAVEEPVREVPSLPVEGSHDEESEPEADIGQLGAPDICPTPPEDCSPIRPSPSVALHSTEQEKGVELPRRTTRTRRAPNRLITE